jgi:hypothetical protein
MWAHRMSLQFSTEIHRSIFVPIIQVLRRAGRGRMYSHWTQPVGIMAALPFPKVEEDFNQLRRGCLIPTGCVLRL